jgi:putative acetyltransferase
VKIRAASPADIETLAAVAVASYRHGFAGILEPDILASCDHAFFAARFSRELAKIALAEEENSIAGFSLVTGRNLDMLFVAPARIGNNIGAKLLAAAEAQGAATLECFRDNEEARRFYERHGWRLERSYTREYLGRTRDFVAYVKDRDRRSP